MRLACDRRPRLLVELLPKPVQTRLNPMVLKKIFAGTFDVTKKSLVFVPAPVTTDGDRRALEHGKKLAEPEDDRDVLSAWMENRPSS